MKRFLRTTFVFVIALMSMVTTAFASSKLESGAEPFYVRSEQNKIYWGGGFSVNEKLSDELYSLFVAFYDNGRLVSVDNVTVDENLKSYTFSEQAVRLPYAPQNLTAKAFAWSMDGKMTPLSQSVDAVIKNDVSENTDITLEQDFTLNVVENNIHLMYLDGNCYIYGDVLVEACGEALYDMQLTVKDYDEIVYLDIVKLDSKIKKFSINEKLNVELYDPFVTIDFIYNGSNLTDTVTKEDVEYHIGTSAGFAVVNRVGDKENLMDGITYPSVDVLDGLEDPTLYGNVLEGIIKGDVIVYNINRDGLVDEVYTLFNAKNSILFDDIIDSYKFKTDKTTYLDKSALNLPKFWAEGDKVELGFGLIIARDRNLLTVGNLEKVDGKYQTSFYEEIELNSDVNVYNYVLDDQQPKFFCATTASLKSTIRNIDTQNVFQWTEAGKQAANVVFYKTVNDEITDIVAVLLE